MKVYRIASNQGFEYCCFLIVGVTLNANAHQARGGWISRVVVNLAVE